MDAPFADYVDLHALPHKAAAGDFDGDGLQEFVMAYVEANELKVRFVDDAQAAFAESTYDVVPDVEVQWLNVAAGDFDGDSIDSLVVSLGTTDVAQLLFLSDQTNGFELVDERLIASTTSGGNITGDIVLSVALAAGNFDNDAAHELALVVNEIFQESNVDSGASRYAILDDALSDYEELASDFVQGQDGAVYSASIADVATGDVDTDGYDEIIIGGLVGFVSGCASNEILTLVLDDATIGNDLAVLGAKHRIITIGTACNVDTPTILRFVNVAAGNLDGDPGEEFTVAHVVYDDWSTPFAEYGWLPPEQMFGPPVTAELNEVNTAVEIADVDGDGAGEIFPLLPGLTNLIGYRVPEARPDTAEVLPSSNTVQWPITGNTYAARPILVAANVDTDSIVAQSGSDSGLPDYELIFTEPIVLAVLAAAPCFDSGSQNTDACSTSYGTGTSSGGSEEGSVAVKGGLSFGAKAIGGALTQSELTAKVTVSLEYAFGIGRSYELAKNVSFDTGPLQDSVVFTSVPYDVYRYTIVQHPDASKIGQLEEVRLPRDPVIVMVERVYYNSSLPSGEFVIDERVLSHTPGDPNSYMSASQKDQLIRDLDADVDLQTGPQSVGQGTGSTSLSIDVSEEVYSSHSLALSAEYEVEAVGGTVLAGYSVGITLGASLSVSTGSTTSFGTTVGDIAEPSEFGADGYSFGLFTYRYDVSTGEQFNVINYWVE